MKSVAENAAVWLAVLSGLLVVFSLRNRIVAAFTFRTTIILATIVLVLMLLNPPWRITIKDTEGHTHGTAIELGWIFTDPSQTRNNTGYLKHQANIAKDVLVVELLAYSAACAGLYFATKKQFSTK